MMTILEYIKFCEEKGLVPCRTESLSKYYSNKNK